LESEGGCRRERELGPAWAQAQDPVEMVQRAIQGRVVVYHSCSTAGRAESLVLDFCDHWQYVKQARQCTHHDSTRFDLCSEQDCEHSAERRSAGVHVSSVVLLSVRGGTESTAKAQLDSFLAAVKKGISARVEDLEASLAVQITFLVWREFLSGWLSPAYCAAHCNELQARSAQIGNTFQVGNIFTC
jgi:hypothetical protein